MIRFIPGLILLILLASCSQGSKGKKDLQQALPQSNNAYASKFQLEERSCYQILRVFNPWQNSREIMYTYILGRDLCTIPDSLSDFPFIRVPVRRVVVMSTTHAAMVCALDNQESIVGASGIRYMYNPSLRQRIEKGLVKEVGYQQGLNYENLVSLHPDVVFFYGVEGSMIPAAEKLEEMGIQVVYCAEYLEEHPLGKAEWIRFFGAFYGLMDQALEIFHSVDSTYMKLAKIFSPLEHQPRVMIGLPWKDTWYIPGANSYAARLINDAGGSFLWEDLNSVEAVPLDLESVYSRAVKAEIWINPGAARSREEIISIDERFALLPVLSHGNIYNNDARLSPGGGNDYWESATVRPDLVLADLISIFHPGAMPDHTLIYYRELK